MTLTLACPVGNIDQSEKLDKERELRGGIKNMKIRQTENAMFFEDVTTFLINPQLYRT